MSLGRVTRAVAVVLLLACCAAGAFAVSETLRAHAKTGGLRPFTPTTAQLHVAFEAGQLPGLPPLSHRSR